MVIVAPVIPKSPTVGCILQLIFGCLGIGRFYIGSIGLGATQLGLWLFGWVLWLALAGWIVWIPLAIWALADAIYIGVGSAKNSQGVPIK